MEAVTNEYIINHMLHYNRPSELQVQYSFLVHYSIYPVIQKFLTRSGIKIMQKLGSYELRVGAHTFDMEILVLGSQNGGVMAFKEFLNLFRLSQFTYFWDEKITLFQEVDRYYQLEKFIAISDLNKHVISVEEISGVNSLGLPIKMVTFDSTIQQDQLIKDFVKFLFNKGYRGPRYRQICHYYFTNAFPWHQPEMPRLFSIPFQNQRIVLGLQTFLTCMRELSYTREPHLDLISLSSLKIAICDDRNLTEASRDLGHEIDALIEQFLRHMQQNQTFIHDGVFDLNRYAVDTDSSFSKFYPAIINLVYTFQNIFHSTNIPVLLAHANIKSYEFTNTLNLNEENKNLNILRGISNIRSKVDAKYYENMNSKLFCELLKCNVNRIHLDTNHKWTNETCLIDFSGNDNSKWVTIDLVGTNQFNFIEDFIQFLKTVPIFLTSKMTLVIEKVNLNSYHIFKKLKLGKLNFVASMLTFTMLTELSDGLVKILEIEFKECTIEDRICTWSVLINGFNRKSVQATIFEAENTWQYLFESITNHLTKFNLNKFKFKCHLMIQCLKSKTIPVHHIKFMIDEFNTQLEMRGLDGQIIDLYYLKYFGVHNETNDDYKNFEFYQ